MLCKKGNIIYLEEMLPITLKWTSIKKNKKLSTNVTLILFQSKNELFIIYGT
jgi:hypothetical protein